MLKSRRRALSAGKPNERQQLTQSSALPVAKVLRLVHHVVVHNVGQRCTTPAIFLVPVLHRRFFIIVIPSVIVVVLLAKLVLEV
jgi:hypothetical protein